jgi:RNA polymerase sigma-70 factor, ECF subfamily
MAMQAAISDEQILSLIPDCQRGDATATEALYELYADRLYRYLLARTGDADAAADLTTELFLRVMKHVGRFRLNRQRPAASFSAWLYRIAGNLATDYHRAGNLRVEASLDCQVAIAAHAPGPDWVAERREALGHLAQAIEGLAEDQRLVVLGKFGEQMSNLEIANMLGKSVGAVKSLQHRALRTLGRMLEVEEA